MQRHRPDFLLFFIILCLVSGGLTMVYSASSVTAFTDFGRASYFFIRQCIWAGLGFVVMLLFMQQSARGLHRMAKPLFMISVLLLIAVAIPHIGTSVNGARRWLDLGPVSLQPSELAVLAVILYGSYLLDKNEHHLTRFRTGVLPPLAITLIIFALIMLEPDLGTGMIVMGTVFCLLFLGGAPLRHLAGLVSAGASGIGLLILLEPYRLSRLTVFLNPWRDPHGDGYQIIQAFYAFASGGWFGRGLGYGVGKYLWLPESHTDFIFAVIAEELGAVGAMALVALFGLYIWRGLWISLRVPDRFLSLVAGGITAMVGLSAFVNLGAVTGILPVTGVPLPFISYGGSSLLIKLAASGMLLNISRYTRAKAVPEPAYTASGPSHRPA
ncbi:MAG: putative lipid II flippase FtsW [Kyrpidia sp.]|nr:putative lipid II flippase FtsW [Kyrpidia sp.]